MCHIEDNKFVQFPKEDGGFIIIRRCGEIYIFSKEGYILFSQPINIPSKSYIIPSNAKLHFLFDRIFPFV